MKQSIRAATLIFFALTALRGRLAHAQAVPTATQALQLSTFAGFTGTYTGLYGGKNLGITAGVDLGLRSYFSLSPALEIRGAYALDQGTIDSQKSALGGLRVAKNFGRLQPYADILYGRGELHYGSGIPSVDDPSFSYTKSASNVLSPGGGVDLRISRHFSLKADAQFQRWSTPLTASHHIYSKPYTFALVYRFHFDHYNH